MVPALVAMAIALAPAVAGCDDDDRTGGATAPATAGVDPAAGIVLADAGLSVAEALGRPEGEHLVVRAFVVVDGGGARLCDVLRESSPPQCGGRSAPVSGLPDELVAGLSEEAGTRWSEQPVQLIGAVRDGTFVKDPTALAAS